ncbi:MAG: methyltransferase domain-containing protein [Mycobacterium sp.]|uniref:class I SAM-dependent methyltransferase n=1 Tax=Mycobacterium sp. TaxID=1785 RepID=UPI002609E35C|nr:class I SAM-dependent methyltransferase [Mycobacterium sp.]MDI3312943.1 methyltransferase domain-containing protein [Mycobacterium sp.]
MSGRKTIDLPGHWLLARLGKRVLRPGGRGLTERMLSAAGVPGADVVELAPGLGVTAMTVLHRKPASYVAVEFDEDAAELTGAAIGARGRAIRGEAAHTGLPDASADVVVGEGILTMQTDAHKPEIAREAYRVLRPGGRYAIHEMVLQDGVDEDAKSEVRRALTRSIKATVDPLRAAEWRQLLTDAGFRIDNVLFAPLLLLEPRRVIDDEGPLRALRFAWNVVRDRDARERVLDMRNTFRKYRDVLTSIAIVATKA